MDASEFELTISLPRDERFAVTVRRLAEHAAQYAGCAEGAAETFGRNVEQALRGLLEEGAAGTAVPVVLRRRAGPVEVLIDSRTISVEV